MTPLSPARFLVRLPKRHPWIRKFLSPGGVLLAKRLSFRIRRLQNLFSPPVHHSSLLNIYHCCTHKTGSQWLQNVLADNTVYRHSGLQHFQYQTEWLGGRDVRPIHERTFDRPFPKRTIVSPLYIDYRNFQAMPLPDPWKAFFVVRDPRDLLVSWYFSTRYSHIPVGEISEQRDTLERLSRSEGLIYLLEYLAEYGVFSSIGSWLEAEGDDRVMLLRFEELASDRSEAAFHRLFQHLGIPLSQETLRELVSFYSFRSLTGRTRGKRDERSHLRGGSAGGWREHFDSRVEAAFEGILGDLPSHLGYE